jgi:hypothetical protein
MQDPLLYSWLGFAHGIFSPGELRESFFLNCTPRSKQDCLANALALIRLVAHFIRVKASKFRWHFRVDI